MAANDSNDKRRAVMREFLATRLRILEIERKALKKLHGEQPSRPTCSFCGKREEEVSVLVPGLDGAGVCDECVELLANELKNTKGD
jgi:hypothetical protein